MRNATFRQARAGYDGDVEIHIHHHHTFESGDGNSKLLAEILKHLVELGAKMSQLDDQITALTAQVAANTNVEKSALVLIQGFSTRLDAAVAAAQAAGASPAQLQSLTDLGTALKSSDDDLAAAVAQNTPSA